MDEGCRILLTGSQGFVGTNLRVYFQKFSNATLLCPTEIDVDLTDSAAVEKCMTAFNPTAIVHSATGNIAGKSYAENICEQNLRMYFNLNRHRPIGCTLYSLCSGSSYNRDNWIENMSEGYLGEHIPTDSQGFSKFVISSHAMEQDDIVILRLFGIFGEHEDYRYKFISNTIAKRVAGMHITLFRDANYSYLDVLDFCKILHELIRKNTQNGVYNVTPDNSTTLSNIISVIDNEMNIKMGFSISEPGWGKPYTGSNARLKTLLPDFEFTPLNKSISRLVEFYNINRHLIDRQALEHDQLLQYARSVNGS